MAKVRLGNLDAGAAGDLAGRTYWSIRGTPAQDQDLRLAAGIVYLQIRDRLGDGIDLCLAQTNHVVVVVGVVGDIARTVGLLQASDAVLKPGGSRNRPRPGKGLGISLVGPKLFGAVVVGVVGNCGEVRIDCGQGLEVGQTPGLGAVGEVAVGQQEHRGAIRDRNAGRFDRGIETICGTLRRHDRHG